MCHGAYLLVRGRKTPINIISRIYHIMITAMEKLRKRQLRVQAFPF